MKLGGICQRAVHYILYVCINELRREKETNEQSYMHWDICSRSEQRRSLSMQLSWYLSISQSSPLWERNTSVNLGTQDPLKEASGTYLDDSEFHLLLRHT